MRQAVIDIGTNTVKLLVAEVQNGEVIPVHATDTMTRLGEGVNASGYLSPSAIERTAQAVTRLVNQARQLDVATIRAFTTSAVRDAHNRQAFLAAMELQVKILTDAQEAEFIFRGVCSDPVWRGRSILVMDIGGGSAEVIQGKDGRVEVWRSLPVGAVRMTERFGEDLPAMREWLRAAFTKELQGFEARPFVATGGANTTLGRIAGRDELTRDEVSAWVTKLHAMPLPQRRQVPGMPADRADIIVAGGAALLTVMEVLNVPKLTVSTRNLRFGVLFE